MARTRIAILGAGPAGVGAAWQLALQNKADVTVLEQHDVVGGNAGSFDLAGLRVDYGSHRLHPTCDPKILNDLRELMGEDLLDRPRHGRIRLQGHWIHFPLKPQDLALRLPISFSGGIAVDALKKIIPHAVNGNGHETFTSVLEKGLGSTICRDFYFPYAKKIWGVPPEELSAIQAHRRVSAGSLGKMLKKVISIVPGFKKPGAGRFYYPRNGYGQITEAIADAAQGLGVEIKFGSTVSKVEMGDTHRVSFKRNGLEETIETGHVWSTIPLTVLAKVAEPPAPAEVFEASKNISYRAMVLIYLVLEQSQWTPYDAHYFPEAEIKLTRLSEPKNYAASSEPTNRTVLCGELPCMVNDEIWNASDEELGEMVKDSLGKCGLPIKSQVLLVATKRLPFAYPIYREGYEKHFELQDEWAGGLD
ncbi:MAG: protoporphyrinogen/coproporphyrinogen oxidase, partial [Blastocatellia bacterium]